jgi:hypothetical protein
LVKGWLIFRRDSRACPDQRCPTNWQTRLRHRRDTTPRILPRAVQKKFVIGAGGELELATAGSTQWSLDVRSWGIVLKKSFWVDH